MARRKKQKIEVNSNDSLQGLLQQLYNNACDQIRDAQSVVNEVDAGAVAEDVDDYAKVAKAKTDALKLKYSGIKAKLDVAKLLADLIKHNGSLTEVISSNTEIPTTDSFAKVREMINSVEKK